MENTQRGSMELCAHPRGFAGSVALGSPSLSVLYDSVSFDGAGLRGTATNTANPRLTVLLAEDNDDLRQVTGWILTRVGCAVVSCRDGQLASEAFRSRTDIGLLLTDLDMPGKSGVELARELTALCPSLAVMIVSGSVIPEDLTREMRNRNWGFLSKPFDIPALLETIQLLLVRTQQQAS